MTSECHIRFLFQNQPPGKSTRFCARDDRVAVEKVCRLTSATRPVKHTTVIPKIPGLLFALAPMLVAAPSGTARAEADEWALSLGAGLRGLIEAPTEDAESASRYAVGLTSRLRYGIDDFWQAGVSIDLGLTIDDAAFVCSLLAEAHYIIDIVSWVPHLTVGVGALVRDGTPSNAGPALRTDLVVSIGGGVEYRPERDFAIGLSARYELVPTDFSRVDGFQVALSYILFFE